MRLAMGSHGWNTWTLIFRDDRAITPADAAEARRVHLGPAPRPSRDRTGDGEVRARKTGVVSQKPDR
jgi:hypothetical protein